MIDQHLHWRFYEYRPPFCEEESDVKRLLDCYYQWRRENGVYGWGKEEYSPAFHRQCVKDFRRGYEA
jgi:hypothetical protein